MPLRTTFIRVTATATSLRIPNRPLHTTRSLYDDHNHHDHHKLNHYEILKVRPDASFAEIKRSYFALSKAHHPDHNPSDPAAARRFMRISEAYAVLGHGEKRARYDRDVMRRHSQSTPVLHGHRRGSYHSSNPAGGRPASGLSRRRGAFTGPPPSFFRSGGWGSHSAKRKAAHEESTGSSGMGTEAGAGTRTNNAGTGGMRPEQNPYQGMGTWGDDVPHFDREAHERTQRRHDERRARRMAASRGPNPFGEDGGGMGDFAVVASVLVTVILGPYIIGKLWFGSDRQKRERESRSG